MNSVVFFDWGVSTKKYSSNMLDITLLKPRNSNIPIITNITSYNYLKINGVDVPLDTVANQKFIEEFNNSNISSIAFIKIAFRSTYNLPKIIDSVEFYCNSEYGISVESSYHSNRPIKLHYTKLPILNQSIKLYGIGRSFKIVVENLINDNFNLSPKDFFNRVTNDKIDWALELRQDDGSTPPPPGNGNLPRATSLSIESPLDNSYVGTSFIVRCFGKPKPHRDGTYSVSFNNNILRSEINPNNINLGEIHNFKWINTSIKRTTLTFMLDGTNYTKQISLNFRE